MPVCAQKIDRLSVIPDRHSVQSIENYLEIQCVPAENAGTIPGTDNIQPALNGDLDCTTVVVCQ